jgi:phosphonate transport system substrate-binding protein
MRSGRLHIAGFNTGSNPLAVACAGFRPFTIMASEDGGFGYEMEIITYPGSGIETVEDIKGKHPGLHLRDLELRLQGAVGDPEGRVRHGRRARISSRSSRASMTTRSSASPTRTTCRGHRQLGDEPDDRPRCRDRTADQVVSIYKSQTFPTTGYGTVYNLKPELAGQDQGSLLQLRLGRLFAEAEEFEKSGEGQFIPMNYKDFWAVIRKIDAANGVEYTCG